MLLKSLPYETFLRKVCSGMLQEKLRRKTIVKNRAYRNAAQKFARTKPFSEKSVAECCRKNCEAKLSWKIERTEMLLKSLPYETFLRNVRSGMLPEKLRIKTIVKNRRTKMLLKRLPYETFLGNIRSWILSQKLRWKTMVENRRTKMLSKKTAKKNYCQR